MTNRRNDCGLAGPGSALLAHKPNNEQREPYERETNQQKQNLPPEDPGIIGGILRIGVLIAPK